MTEELIRIGTLERGRPPEGSVRFQIRRATFAQNMVSVMAAGTGTSYPAVKDRCQMFLGVLKRNSKRPFLVVSMDIDLLIFLCLLFCAATVVEI